MIHTDELCALLLENGVVESKGVNAIVTRGSTLTTARIRAVEKRNFIFAVIVV